MRRNMRSRVDWSAIIVGGVAVLGFVCGGIYNGFSYTDKLATKPYVDDRFIAATKYTDEKTAQILKEAYEHSDTNRREMAIEHAKEHQDFMSQFASAQSSQAVKIGTMETQLGNVLTTVREMRDTAWDAFEEQKIHRRVQK